MNQYSTHQWERVPWEEGESRNSTPQHGPKRKRLEAKRRKLQQSREEDNIGEEELFKLRLSVSSTGFDSTSNALIYMKPRELRAGVQPVS